MFGVSAGVGARWVGCDVILGGLSSAMVRCYCVGGGSLPSGRVWGLSITARIGRVERSWCLRGCGLLAVCGGDAKEDARGEEMPFPGPWAQGTYTRI